jgi:hypothetical protein
MVVQAALAVVTLTILVAGCDSAAPVYVYSKPGATLEQRPATKPSVLGALVGASPAPRAAAGA